MQGVHRRHHAAVFNPLPRLDQQQRGRTFANQPPVGVGDHGALQDTVVMGAFQHQAGIEIPHLADDGFRQVMFLGKGAGNIDFGRAELGDQIGQDLVVVVNIQLTLLLDEGAAQALVAIGLLIEGVGAVDEEAQFQPIDRPCINDVAHPPGHEIPIHRGIDDDQYAARVCHARFLPVWGRYLQGHR